jgi:alcohol dehydrogenase class IV
MRFEFATATRIIFGPGTLIEAGTLAKNYGSRVLVVTGTSRRSDKLLDILTKEGIGSETFRVSGEPTLALVRQGVEFARKRECKVVMAFGGGSVIDAGKAIAAMLPNPGDLLDYVEVVGAGKSLSRDSEPFVAIPTTAGTGSEVTRNAVLASTENQVKVSLRSTSMLPKVAIIDPESTHDLPPGLTATTGLDALTQLIEPYVCVRPNPMTDALCLEGLRRAARSLRKAVQDGHDASAREDMAVAALFSGMALANAGLGAVHGFAGPIGGMFPAPHGAVCAALLPHVMAINIRAAGQNPGNPASLKRFEELARILTNNPHANIQEGVDWVKSLVEELRIPKLGSYGILPEHIPGIVEKSERASSMKANPVVLSPAELSETLSQAL